MKLAYVDTSVLLAIAFGEPSASDLASLLAEQDRLVASNLLEAEFRAALARERVPGGEDLLSWVRWLFPDRSLGAEMRRVLGQGYLGGADLWHVSCALYLHAEMPLEALITLDERQRAVGRGLGLGILP